MREQKEWDRHFHFPYQAGILFGTDRAGGIGSIG